ncbi:MAG TPA: hypothetical protein VI385_07910 [Flavisolibacter sp.]|jgi:hypothetical protein
MNYLRHLFIYFENVLHPASGWNETNSTKKKRISTKSNYLQNSPECFNLRGGVIKKQDKVRRSPAP